MHAGTVSADTRASLKLRVGTGPCVVPESPPPSALAPGVTSLTHPTLASRDRPSLFLINATVARAATGARVLWPPVTQAHRGRSPSGTSPSLGGESSRLGGGRCPVQVGGSKAVREVSLQAPENLHPGGRGLRNQPARRPCRPASPADSGPTEGAHPGRDPACHSQMECSGEGPLGPTIPQLMSGEMKWPRASLLALPQTPRTGGFDSRRVFPQFWGPGGQGPGAAGLAASGALSLSCRRLATFPPCPRGRPSVHAGVCVLIPLLIRTPVIPDYVITWLESGSPSTTTFPGAGFGLQCKNVEGDRGAHGVVCGYTTECYLAMERNEVLKSASTSMNLGDLVLSIRSQMQKAT